MNWRRALVNKILEVQLPYLFKDIPDENIRPVFIDVEFGLDDEPTCDEDVHGECVSLGEMFDMKWYRITLARNLTRERLIRHRQHNHLCIHQHNLHRSHHRSQLRSLHRMHVLLLAAKRLFH